MRRSHLTDCRQRWSELAFAVLAFLALVLAVSSLWRDNLFLTLLMLGEFAVVLGLWHDRHDLSFLLVIGGMGSLAEAVFVRSGAWSYTNPSFLGIPMWFPIAFGTAGLIGGRLARTIAAVWQKKGTQREFFGPRS
jgi:hypothetical protein